MDEQFQKFGGASAILTGIGALVYAVFFLIIGKQAGDVGKLGSWVILAVNGLFTLAAYVALYQRTRTASAGLSLWGLLLGFAQGLAMMGNGVYQAVYSGPLPQDPFARGVLSPIDPKGLGTFFLFGLASFVFGWLILHSRDLPTNLGYVGMINALLLVILFFSNVYDFVPGILGAGGLTSVVITPLWWIWIGRHLRKQSVVV
jgi:hypothetical protein